MSPFDPYYWRVIFESPVGILMLALFLVALFLIIESFSRRSLWRAEGARLGKRVIFLRTSGILLPLLGALAYLQSVRQSFDALRAAEMRLDRFLLADGIYRILTTFSAGLWMGILVLICATVLETKAQTGKARE